jgi:hypothetical protein
MGEMMSNMLEGLWAITGAIASVAVLVLYILIEFIKPAWRRYRLKRPCDVSFSIPPLRGGQSEYAILDDEPHATKEITVPPNAEFSVELRHVPRLNFVESEFAFGCDRDENLDKKPFAIGYVNYFIERGKRTASPEDDDSHYTDRHQYYHIRRVRQRSIGQHFVVGLTLKTRAVGLYKAEVWITTEEKQSIHQDLTIRVEEPQKTLMKCILHNGCYVRPHSRVV